MTTAGTSTNARVVCITGATGFVGRYAARELAARGWRVRALARSADKARGTLPEGVDVVVGDVFNADAMRELARGCAAMVHLIGIRMERRGGVTFQRMHVEATRRAIDAARESGVARFVQMSALGVRADGRCAYATTKFEAEMLVRGSGLRWTILRPSIIHGADGEFMRLVKGWATGKAPPFVFLPYFERLRFDGEHPLLPPVGEAPLAQPVAVEDVAHAIAESLEREEAEGEVYPLGGPDALTWPELLETVQGAIPGAKKWMAAVGIPAPVAEWKAKAAAAIGLAGLLPFGPSEPVMGSEDNVCSNVKAKAHLGFEPRPFAPTVRAYAARM